MEIFNAGADKFSIGFEEGGVPYYNTDVLNSQDNAQLWGLPSMYRNYNMVLSGCLVDELNLSNSTIKIKSGFVLIQNLVYKVPAYEGVFPVELKVADPIVEQRDFKSGETHDATLKYTISWVTNLSTGTATNFPIQFKPFCNQRVENYNENMGKVKGEIREVMVTKNTRSKTDTGKTIVGGAVSLSEAGVFAGWEQVVDARVTVATDNSQFTPLGLSYGNRNVLLTKFNLPPHQHELTNGVNSSTALSSPINGHTHGKGTLDTVDGGSHTHKFSHSGDNQLDHQSKYPNARNYPDVYMPWSDMGMLPSGNHGHDITGSTANAGSHQHTLSGNTGLGTYMSSNQMPVSISQPSTIVLRLKFVGYPQMFNHTTTFANIF